MKRNRPYQKLCITETNKNYMAAWQAVFFVRPSICNAIMHCSTSSVTWVLEACLQHLQEQYGQKLVFSLSLALVKAPPGLLCVLGLPHFTKAIWKQETWEDRVSEHISCEESLEELGFFSQAKRRVREGIAIVCNFLNSCKEDAKLFSGVPDDVAIRNKHKLWRRRLSLWGRKLWGGLYSTRAGCQQGCRVSIFGGFLDKARHGQLTLPWWWPCSDLEAASWSPEVPFSQLLCTWVVFVAVLRLR